MTDRVSLPSTNWASVRLRPFITAESNSIDQYIILVQNPSSIYPRYEYLSRLSAKALPNAIRSLKSPELAFVSISYIFIVYFK
jgi:hypothetical protein